MERDVEVAQQDHAPPLRPQPRDALVQKQVESQFEEKSVLVDFEFEFIGTSHRREVAI